MKNCIDIIRPFTDSIREYEDVQLIGGVGSAALTHADTVIDVENKEVIASADLFLSQRRPDGTLRDVDVLVKTSDRGRLEEVEAVLDQSVGADLEQSVFGIKTHEVLKKQVVRPFGFTAFKTFLSDRYDSPDAAGVYVKSLFPFSVPLDTASLETWHLSVGDMRAPIPNPAISIVNYTNRSIGGLRPKDREKITGVSELVFAKAPELREWLLDGPGKDQVELTRLINSLVTTPTVDLVGYHRPKLSTSALAEHDAFMASELRMEQKRRILGVAAFKANGLHFFESNPLVVSLWQQFAERHAALVVKNT